MALFSMGNGHHGSLAPSSKNKKFLLATIGYSTKWVEAKPLAQIREVDAINFNCRNILSRFGIPIMFVSDNGLQFVSQKLKNMLYELKIEFYNSTSSYP